LYIFILCRIIKNIRALSGLIFIFFINLFSDHYLLRIMSFILTLLRHIDNIRRFVFIFDFHWNAVPWSIWRMTVGYKFIFRFDTLEVVHVYALVHFITIFWVFRVHIYRIIIICVLWIFYLLVNEVFFIKVTKIKSLESMLLMIWAISFLTIIFHFLHRV
jgi:hypothetical protein